MQDRANAEGCGAEPDGGARERYWSGAGSALIAIPYTLRIKQK